MYQYKKYAIIPHLRNYKLNDKGFGRLLLRDAQNVRIDSCNIDLLTIRNSYNITLHNCEINMNLVLKNCKEISIEDSFIPDLRIIRSNPVFIEKNVILNIELKKAEKIKSLGNNRLPLDIQSSQGSQRISFFFHRLRLNFLNKKY